MKSGLDAAFAASFFLPKNAGILEIMGKIIAKYGEICYYI